MKGGEVMKDYILAKVAYTGGRSITVETNHVGYYVWVLDPQDWEVNRVLRIYVHTCMTNVHGNLEEQIYGFKTLKQRSMFSHIIALKGLGPMTALSIMRNVSWPVIACAVANNDVEALKEIPTISERTANTLCEGLSELYPNYKGLDTNVMKEVVESLNVLGYSIREIELGLCTVENWEDKPIEMIISEIIRNLTLVA